MSDLYLLLTPALAAGVVGLMRFIGCDGVAFLNPVTPNLPVTLVADFDPAQTPPTRANFTGWAGMMIQPHSDQTLVKLGRWCLPGNAQAHQMKVVDAGSGMDIPGAIVIVPLAGAKANSFKCVDLPTPVPLTANQMYYILSQEQEGMNLDTFFDYSLQVNPSADFLVPQAVYGDPTGTPPIPYTPMGGTNNCYVPVTAAY